VSWQAVEWVLEHSRSKGTARSVLAAIANHVDPDGEGWVYVTQVCDEAKCCLKTYHRALRWAVENGELTREVNAGTALRARGDKKPNLFRFTMSTPSDCPPRQIVHPVRLSTPRPPRPPQDVHPEPLVTTEPSKNSNNPCPVSSELPLPLPAVSAAPTAVELVFAAWQEATGHTRSRLDDKRKRVITKALAAYPLDDVCDAVRGWRHSPHHRGENDRRTVYDDLGLLLRDAAHIEKFRDLEQHGPSPPSMTRSAHNLLEWRDRSARNGLF
jgi:hypothetical protein